MSTEATKFQDVAGLNEKDGVQTAGSRESVLSESVSGASVVKVLSVEEADAVTWDPPKSKCVFAMLFDERSSSIHSLWKAFTRSPAYFWAYIGYAPHYTCLHL